MLFYKLRDKTKVLSISFTDENLGNTYLTIDKMRSTIDIAYLENANAWSKPSSIFKST